MQTERINANCGVAKDGEGGMFLEQKFCFFFFIKEGTTSDVAGLRKYVLYISYF